MCRRGEGVMVQKWSLVCVGHVWTQSGVILKVVAPGHKCSHSAGTFRCSSKEQADWKAPTTLALPRLYGGLLLNSLNNLIHQTSKTFVYLAVENTFGVPRRCLSW